MSATPPGFRPAAAPPGRKAPDPYGEGQPAARARRLRSLGIALALIGFVVLIFIVSVARLSANMHHG